MIAPNTIVGGRYRVVRMLGGGGMKIVYLAEDLRLAARPCALAEMVDGLTNPEAQQQAVLAFQREADMLAQLGNEHIPRIFDRFSEGNHHYLVMEYVDGATLEDEIKRHNGKLAPPIVIDIAIQILETLEYLHGLTPPVIYRDLKPSNVMLSSDGRAKLIDFGIARHFAPLVNATMIGTQGYAPPEQYRGRVEARSDIYALAATMHHALSGRDPAAEPPFSFPALRKAAPELDPALTALVDQALAYDVTARVRDATEFRHRLLEIRDRPRREQGSNLAAELKPQLPLPLPTQASAANGGAAQDALRAAASAPTTIVAVNPEIRCGACTRMIPADSRFCSFCGVAVRHPDALGAQRANDPTVVLSPVQDALADDAPPTGARRRRARRSGLKRPMLLILLIFGAAFATMKLVAHSIYSDSTPGADTPDMPAASAVSPLMQLRLMALRQALDDSGYGLVKFRIVGNSLVLTGTVPDERARLTVQQMCLGITGISEIRNHLRLDDSSFAG
jgi:serine/threonine protein kinase